MNLRGVLIFAVSGFGSTAPLAAADAAKVDYTQRNEPFAPAAGAPLDKRTPEHNRTVQDRRVALGHKFNGGRARRTSFADRSYRGP